MGRSPQYRMRAFLLAVILLVSSCFPLTAARTADISDWVPAESIPSNARVFERRWLYNRITYRDTTQPSLDGFSETGFEWVTDGTGRVNYASFPAGFDTGHEIYQSFAKSPYEPYENQTSKREVSDSEGGYVYWHWMYDCGGANGYQSEGRSHNINRAIFNRSGFGTGAGTAFHYHYFGAFTSSNGDYYHSPYFCNQLGIETYFIPETWPYEQCQGSTRWFRFEYRVSSYTDSHKLFHFKKEEVDLSSSESVTAHTEYQNDGRTEYANIREQVRYYLSYTVTFHAEGSETPVPGAMKKLSGVDLVLPDTILRRTGYEFIGWSPDRNAAEARYQPGGYYTTEEDAALYALWREKSYTISYDANGGENPPASQSLPHDGSLTLRSDEPTRNGYGFLGWSRLPNASSVEFHPGDAYSANADLKLYAVWYQNKRFDTATDAFSFRNDGASFGYQKPYGPGDAYPIPRESFQDIFGNSVTGIYVYNKTRLGTWRGNCNGMASCAALLFGGNDVSVGDFGKETVYALTPDDTATVTNPDGAAYSLTLRRFIENMQVAQFTNAFTKIYKENRITSESLQKGATLNGLFEAVASGTADNQNAVIAVSVGSLGHALLAYDAERVSPTEARLHIYDCNHPYPQENDRYLTLTGTESGDLTAWSYDMGGNLGVWTSETEGAIAYIPYESVEYIWTHRTHLYDGKSQMMSVSGSDFSVMDADKREVARLENGVLTVEDNSVCFVPRLDVAENADWNLYLPENVYTVENLRPESVLSASVSMEKMGATVSTTLDEITFAVSDSENMCGIILPDAAENDSFSVELTLPGDERVFEGTGVGEGIAISTDNMNDVAALTCNLASYKINGTEQMTTHTIFADCDIGGRITPSGACAIEEGDDANFTIHTEEGVSIRGVYVDGIQVGCESHYNFPDVSENHTISVRLNGAEFYSANAYIPEREILFSYRTAFDAKIIAVLSDPSGKMVDLVAKNCRKSSAQVTDKLKFNAPILQDYHVKLIIVDAESLRPLCPRYTVL